MNIHKLIENNQWDKIYNLIKSKKIDYNKEITNGNTILHYASIHNNNKIIKYFIDHNLDAFNKSNKEGDTPIHLLAKYGYTTLLKEVLLKNKDGVNLINNNNETVINILYNNLDFIKWIISNYKGNIKITNYNSNGDNILTKNIEESENKSDHNYGVLSLLLKKFQGKINEEDTSLLSLAIESNKDHIVDLLLQNNYDVNKKDKKFMTPLNYAIINNDYNLMKRLINKGADINYNGPEGDFNSMIYAINNGDSKTINFLLDHGYNVNSFNRKLETPLHHALFKKNQLKPSLISKLIYEGDLNLKNIDGITPLHLLCKYHQIDHYFELLKHKELDIFVQDNKNKTPLDYLKGNNVYPFLDNVVYSYMNLLEGKVDQIEKCKKNNVSKECQLELKKYMFQTRRSIPMREDKKRMNNKIKIISGNPVNHGLFNADTLHNMIYTIFLLKRYKNLCIPFQYFDEERFINDKMILSNNLIKSDADKIITDLIRVYTENFYEITPYLIIWKNINQYHVHKNLMFMLKKCLTSSQIRFIYLKLSLITKFNTIHANIIFYDKFKNTLERFEPYGDVPYIESKSLDQFVEDLGKKYINPNLKYYSPKEIMGEVGFQVISNDNQAYVKKLGDPVGYCLAWTIWYIEMRINNPDTDPKKLIKDVKDNIVNSNNKNPTESLFISFIRNYSALLDKYKNEFMMDAGISMNSIYNLVFNIEDEGKIIDKMRKELNSLFRG